MENVKPTEDPGAETEGLSLGAVVLPVALPDAEQAVRDALGSEGFGVLSEVDISATLKAKLGVERAPLKILGACNPTLADRALQLEPDAAMVLPCNVVLSGQRPGQTTVRVADPRKMLPSGSLSAIAEEAADLLGAVLRKLS